LASLFDPLMQEQGTMTTIEAARQRFEGIEAIVFDKDGTLARTEDYLTQLTQARTTALNALVPEVGDLIARAFGLTHDPDGTPQLNAAGLMAIGSRQDNEIAAAAYVAARGHNWSDARAMVKAAFTTAETQLPPKAPQTPPIDGCREMLDRLRAGGVKLGILSADRSHNITGWIEEYGFTEHFYASRGSDQPPSKPKPEALLALCEQLGVGPKQVLAIGDASSDMSLALAAGVAGTIGITVGWRSAPYIQQADAILGSWAELRIVE
jgi:phosphoglycolate phosphatase